jgi:nucleoside-diphosphate-sugar epimerase
MVTSVGADSIRGRRALVLGASGFVGQWVARRLDQSGAELVLGVRDPRLVAGLVTELRERPDVHSIDLLEPGAVEAMLQATRPDVTFNLVGYGVDSEERDEKLFERTNAHLPATLCEQIARLPAEGWEGQRLIHTGSALEYGVSAGDLAEHSRPQPTTSYGRTKLAGTEALQRWRHDEGLPTMTARLFTVYGMGEHSNRLLPSLIDAAQRTDPLELTAGLQMRDFTYVEDVAEGLLRLSLVSGRHEGVVNLATGRLTMVRDFVLIAANVLGIPGERLLFGSLPTRPEEMSHEPVSLVRLRRTLSWAPATEIRDGVMKTLQWLMHQGKTESQIEGR